MTAFRKATAFSSQQKVTAIGATMTRDKRNNNDQTAKYLLSSPSAHHYCSEDLNSFAPTFSFHLHFAHEESPASSTLSIPQSGIGPILEVFIILVMLQDSKS